jgi:hypothetical protein
LDISSSARCVILPGDWDILRVAPGIDVDRFQTVLAICPLGSAPAGERGKYDLYEIGVAQNNGLFFRSASFLYDEELTRTCERRRYDLVSEDCHAVCLGDGVSIFSALIIPFLEDHASNVVELVFEEETDGEESSAPTRASSCSESSLCPSDTSVPLALDESGSAIPNIGEQAASAQENDSIENNSAV